MTGFILGLFEITIGMSLLIALLLLTLKLFGKKFTAKCRYIIWTLVIIRLIIPFGSGLLPSFIEIPIKGEVFQAEDIPAALSEDDAATLPSQPSDFDVLPITPGVPNANPNYAPISPSDTAASPLPTEPSVDVQTDTPIEPSLSWNQILNITAIVYFGGAAAFLLWNLAAYCIYTRKILRSVKEADSRAVNIYRSVCKKYRMKKLPTLLVASGIHSPAAFGLFHRRIVLPDMDFTENGLVGTLAHEVTHCRRGDLYVKFAALIARALGWFNPLVHLAAFKCEMEMELSCDEAVLNGSNDETRAAYGEVMLDIIRRCRRNRGMLTTHFNPKKNAVSARFKNILYGSGKRRGRIFIGVCLVLCVLAGTFVACRTGEYSGDNLVEGHFYQEGYYIKCSNGSDVIVVDAEGANPASPCKMTAADDSVSFDGLTDGDRIKIEVFLIEETYPAHTKVYSIEKLSDGEREDIDAAVLDSLRELGWIEALPDYQTAHDCYRGVHHGEINYQQLLDNYSDIISANIASQTAEVLSAYRNSEDPTLLLPSSETAYAEYPAEDIIDDPTDAQIEQLLRNASIITDNKGHQRILLKLDIGNHYHMVLPIGIGGFGESVESYFCGIYFENASEEFDLVQTDSITSLADYKLLGADFYESYYQFTEALIDGDTAKMEELSMYPAGTFDSYKGVSFTFQSITREAETGRFILTAEVSEGHEVIPSGTQRFYYCEYPRRGLEPILEPTASNATEASATLSRLLNMTMKYDLNEMEVTEYIIDCLCRKTGRTAFTEGEIVEYAKKCFGAEDFTPNEHFKSDGLYTSLAHGGTHIYHDVISTNCAPESGIYRVTVRFYADYAKTVYSHLIEYRMVKLDGDFAFIGQKIDEDRSLQPFTHAT